MQKLSSDLVKKIVRANLTQAELSNLLLIARLQDSAGRILGLSYRYTSDILKRCYQTFYNAKKGLEEKGFIKTRKENWLDIDVEILGNDFSDHDFSKGYIDLQLNLFEDEDFYKMSANEMAMALDILRMRFDKSTAAQGIDTKTLIKSYMDGFHVTERAVRKYLQKLRKYFYINCCKHKYFFRLKDKWQREEKAGRKVEEDRYREHVALAACKRANIKMPAENAVRDLKGLVQQYAKAACEEGKEIAALLIEAVGESVRRRNEGLPRTKWSRGLSVPHVHTILREAFN